MPELRIESIAELLASDVDTSLEAVRLLSRAQVVGALPSMPEGQVLDGSLIRSTLAALDVQGVGRDAHLRSTSARTAEDFHHLLDAANEQLEHSPLPASTWPVLVQTLGEELLAELVAVAQVSVRRYARGQRATPLDVAQRLHFVALLVADLSGAYNDYGIRRWFIRSRAHLDGATPVDLLAGGFDPDSAAAQRVRELATSLVAAGAT